MIKDTLLVVLITLLLSCGGSKTDRQNEAGSYSPDTNVGGAGSGGTSTPSVTAALKKAIDKYVPIVYETDLKPVLATYCTSCHTGTSGEGKLDLSTIEVLKTNVSAAISDINADKMPPAASSLSSDQKDELDNLMDLANSWNSNGTPSDVTKLTGVTWKNMIGPLNAATCATCHADATGNGSIAFATQKDWENNWDKGIAQMTAHQMPEKVDNVRIDRMLLLLKQWKTLGYP